MARLAAINPQVKLVPHRQALDEDSLAAVLAQVDLVLDCCDNFSTREAVNAACVAAGKPLVSGAAIRLEGQLSVFDPRRDDSPCYHCLYGHGSEAELTCSEAGVAGPLVGLVGSLQALEALKLLAGFGEPLVGRLLLVDALGTRFRELRVKRGLITDGMHKHIRHPNYLGEMMIYGSFAMMVGHWLPWLWLAYIWGSLFAVNMALKEASMSRYPEWADYKKRTWWLVPYLF